MRKIICAILLLAFVMTMNAQSETLYFDVLHKGKNIGSLKTEKSTDGNNVRYVSSTIIEFHMFTTIEIIFNYDVSYQNNTLNKSAVKIKVHGHLKTDVMTEKAGNQYIYYSEGEKEKSLSGEIVHSIEKMFYEEPIGVSKVYAEEHGVFHDLKEVKEHVYLKTTPEGHKSTYYYKNGKLQKSDIDAGIISFSIVLNE